LRFKPSDDIFDVIYKIRAYIHDYENTYQLTNLLVIYQIGDGIFGVEEQTRFNDHILYIDAYCVNIPVIVKVIPVYTDIANIMFKLCKRIGDYTCNSVDNVVKMPLLDLIRHIEEIKAIQATNY
jgi:hypothetical protein